MNAFTAPKTFLFSVPATLQGLSEVEMNLWAEYD